MKYPSGYGIVFKKVMCDPSISVPAKALYSLLASFTGADEDCWPSMETMAKCLSCSENSIRNWMRELEKTKWLEVSYSKGHHPNHYKLVIPPTPVDEPPKELEGIHPTGLDPTNNSLTSNIDNIAPSRTVSTPKPYFNFLTRKWDNISDEMVKLWEIAYPACAIETELAQMAAWLLANPTKKKTPNGYGRFITTWLGRSQNRGGTKWAS
jgi:hypothetical protein